MKGHVYFFVHVCQSVPFVCQVFCYGIDILRLVVCWNHIDGVAVWWVSPHELLESSLHTALTLCRRCCGKFVANVYVLKAIFFVFDRLMAGLFHGDLVGSN